MKTRTRTLITLAASTALAAAYAPTTIAGAASARSGSLGPEVHLTSAVAGDSLARGAASPGVSGEGSGFAINVEAQSHDSTGIAVKEGLNIRNTTILGQPNPNFPGLVVTVDSALTTPSGGVIPANTNLAALFNIAGTDDTPGRGITVWAGWHVLESLAPTVTSLTVTASVTDTVGRTGTDSVIYAVDTAATTGQALTPQPAAGVSGSPVAGVAGPLLDFAAPEHPTKVAIGTHPSDGPASLQNGALFFIQLDALDVAQHGIAVDENGGGPTAAPGPIASPGSISTTPGGGGANPNVPGLDFSFDVALQQPNGHVINAGENLGALFNVAGSAVGPQGAVRTTLDWVVGGKLLIPADQDTVLMTARVTDSQGGSTVTTRRVGLSEIASGQLLTPQP